MGKICAVSGCNSGSHTNQNERKSLGLRQITLFRVPKCEKKRQQWANSVGIAFRPMDCVCELHFPDKDVQRVNVFQIDGKTHVLPRERFTLEKDAVPENRVFERQPPIVSESRTIGDENVVDVEEDNGQTVQAGVDQGNVLRTILQNDVEPDEDNDVQPDEENDVEPDEENEVSPDEDNDVEPVEQKLSTIEDLKRILRERPLPVNWSWAISPVSSDEIVFIQIDPLTLKIRFYLYIYNDLTVTIRTADGVGELKLEEPITAISELEDLIYTTEKAKACSGSGVRAESRSKDCTAIVEERYQRFKTPRCVYCRKIRKLQLKNVSRNTTDAKTR